jgi:uncharacterized protein (TIGR02594 family)
MTSIQQPPQPHLPWMRIAQRYEGLRERTDDGKLAQVVRDFFRFTRFPPHLVNERTSWCAAFACTVLEIAGLESPHSAKARHFLDWGLPLARPVYGSILVFSRGPLEIDERGHVGFCARELVLHAGDVACLAGNQDNAVCTRRKKLDRLLGVRWPKEWPLPDGAEVAKP